MSNLLQYTFSKKGFATPYYECSYCDCTSLESFCDYLGVYYNINFDKRDLKYHIMNVHTVTVHLWRGFVRLFIHSWIK